MGEWEERFLLGWVGGVHDLWHFLKLGSWEANGNTEGGKVSKFTRTRLHEMKKGLTVAGCLIPVLASYQYLPGIEQGDFD